MSAAQPVQKVVTTPVHELGTRAALSDGRVFYYASNSGSAIAAGQVVSAPAIGANFTNIAVSANAAIGATSVSVTLGGSSTVAANAYAGGYLVVNDATGEGYTYKIKGHAAVSSSTAMTVDLWDPIVVALVASTSEVTLMKSPWADVVASPSTAVLPVGVAPVAVGAGSTTVQYFWAQTWGVSAVLDTDTSAIGTEAALSATAGAVAGIGGAGTTQTIGVFLVAGIATENRPKFLQIAP